MMEILIPILAVTVIGLICARGSRRGVERHGGQGGYALYRNS